MNFKKSIAAIAAASITAVSASAAAGAELVVQGGAQDANGMDLVCASSTSWMPIAYNNGERNESVLADKNKAIVDYGVDWTQAKSVEVQFHITEDTREDFAEENNFGGAIIVSSNAAGNSDHNWNAKEFYGVNDDALEFTAESAKELQAEKVSDYTYKVVCPIDDTNSVVPNAQMVQIAFSDYAGAVWWQAVVDYMAVKDASGNDLIRWDGATGKATAASASATEATEEASATGNVDAATDSSKGSPDTGIADVAAVAGLAILAGAGIAFTRKSK